MITTTGIYHIGIPVNDVERAVKFYTEVLGMKIAKLNRDDMGDHLNRADLRSGDALSEINAKVQEIIDNSLLAELDREGFFDQVNKQYGLR